MILEETIQRQDSLTSRHRAILSCLSCHKQKRRCNRQLPCDQCQKRSTACQYQSHQIPPDRNVVEPESPEQSITRKPDRTVLYFTSIGSSQVNTRDYRLMGYFIGQLKPRIGIFLEVHDNVEIDWLLAATQHPASFYAILYCGATIYAKEILDREAKKCPLHACLHYKLAALDAINKQIGEKTHAAVTDEMMLAVLILMNFDSVMESFDEYKVHLEGLDQMVNIRGGSESLGYNGLLKNWYHWCHSILMNARSRAILSELQDFHGSLTSIPGIA